MSIFKTETPAARIAQAIEAQRQTLAGLQAEAEQLQTQIDEAVANGKAPGSLLDKLAGQSVKRQAVEQLLVRLEAEHDEAIKRETAQARQAGLEAWRSDSLKAAGELEKQLERAIKAAVTLIESLDEAQIAYDAIATGAAGAEVSFKAPGVPQESVTVILAYMNPEKRRNGLTLERVRDVAAQNCAYLHERIESAGLTK